MTCDQVRPLLNARVDGEIASVKRTAIDSHVNTCESCAAYLEELKSVRHKIRNETVYHRAPAALRERVRIALRGAEYLEGRARPGVWRVWAAVAAAIILLALGAAPFLVNARNQRQLVAEELLSAHERALLGQGVDVVSTDQHTVKPWFDGKLPFSPPVPNPADEGFPLAGGRLDYAGEYPVAALVYSRRLHRIDVFVWPGDGRKTPPSHFERNGYNEISWKKNNFVFVAISDLNAAELSTFAGLLQRP